MNFIERFTRIFAPPVEDTKEPFQAAYEEAYEQIITLIARLQREKAIALHEPRVEGSKEVKRVQLHIESVAGKSLGYIDLFYTPRFERLATLFYYSPGKTIEKHHTQLEQFIKEVEVRVKQLN
jgi:hypothetical protein